MGLGTDSTKAYLVDSAYEADFCQVVTVPHGSTAAVTARLGHGKINYHEIVVCDVTQLLTGAAPSTAVAAWMRLDGSAPTNAITGDNSWARPIPASGAAPNQMGTRIKVNRVIGDETQIVFQNPNGADVKILVELGG